MNFSQSSTTVGAQNAGHVTEGQTQATLGLGNVQVGGQALDDSNAPANLNRDVAEGQITTRDQQTGGLDASATLEYDQLTLDGWSEIIDDQLSLVSNTLKASAGAVADAARVGAVAGSVFELSIEQSVNAWNTVGQGHALAYHNGGELAGLVEGMRDGDIEDGFVLQEGLTAVVSASAVVEWESGDF